MNKKLIELVKPVYNAYIRQFMPTKRGVRECNGIPVPNSDADPSNPKITDISGGDVPKYKQELLEAIREYVFHGQSAAIIGAGRGVSSVVALRQGAIVTAYEAAAEMLPIAQQTVDWQGYSDNYELVHGVVGDAIEVYGRDLGDAIPPSSITASIVIMDCEGAEKSIVENLPGGQTLIIETHPERGVPTDGTVASLPSNARIVSTENVADTEKQILVVDTEAEDD